MSKLIGAILTIILVLFLVWAVGYGLDKQAKADCLRYQYYAKEYKDFYLTIRQKEICEELNIFVDAPVKEIPRFK